MSGPVRTVVEATVGGRLSSAYPASVRDVELRVTGAEGGELTDVLVRESTALLAADPGLRKVVFAARADDLAQIAAAEAAGFRFVVEVDLPGEELALLVREPDWVTRVDMDLDRVPT